MDKRQGSFDSLKQTVEETEALVEKANNIENLSPEEQTEVIAEIKNFNETRNPFKDTSYDPSFADPVGSMFSSIMPFAIGAILIGALVTIIILIRSKRIKQAAARKKANATKRNNEALLSESLAADKTEEKESLEEELATLKAELELKMKNVPTK